MKLRPARLRLLRLLRVLPLLPLLFSTAAVAQAPVELCFDENPPYTQDATVPRGIKVELARAVFARLGLSINVRLLPFARCLKMVELGAMDGALPLSMNDERAAYMQFSKPVFLQTMAFIYNKARFPQGLHWESLNDLKHYRLTLNLGSIIDSQMEAMFDAERHLQRANDAKSIVRMVAAGRTELAAMDRIVAEHVIRNAGLSHELAVSEQAISASHAYFGISRKSPVARLVPELNQAIQALQNSGEIARITAVEY